LYSSAKASTGPPPDLSKYLRLGIIAIIAIIAFLLVGNQAVVLFMNFEEFADLFTTPLYFALISSVTLSVIALVRVNIVKRHSILWYTLRTAIGFINRNPTASITESVPSFHDHKISVPHFVIWQITKVLLFGAFFANVFFGFAIMQVIDGNDLGVENIIEIFSLPFVTPPTDYSYATEKVIPMIPALLILVPPLIAAIGLRLLLFIGVHHILKVLTNAIHDTAGGKPKYLKYTSTLEVIVGIAIVWAAFNMFFTSDIDYNTKYAIGGMFVIGFALIAFSVFDRIRSRVLTHMLKRDVYIRIFTIIAIAIVVGVAMSVNTSVADAKKIEYLGPYTAQQIGVNRYLAELDQVEEHIHDVTLNSISPNQIDQYIESNADVLDGIRVWDWEAAFAKLKPEIGLIPYVNFEDNDILRFDDKLYWTASMAPILPTSVSAENRWYNEHLVYTHVPNGFLTLEATDGKIVDSSELFPQRKIYYGEGGLLSSQWSAYPTNRGSTTAELNNESYAGAGGLEIAPPVSWMFEPNFMISYPGTPVHVMRYKDVNERMETLYPYFLYNLFGKELDSLPVTDGENTYWLVPLIVGFDSSNIPWSAGNPYLRLAGYALVDTYNGDIQLIRHGNDFFSNMFLAQYEHNVIDMPGWLEEQIRYPQELYNWRTEMYNIYHVTDVDIFIQANEFYEIPRGLDTYYIQAKPPGFEEPEFVGLLSLELRGSQGRNLAGYMVVQNDTPNLGHMQFYEVPIESATKLLGPTSVREALDRDPDFAQLKTLLRNPRIGDNILYQVGEHDTYFIPVYTAGAGGVVAQLGTIAAVGAAFTGEYYVGLGDTQESAFEAYLQKVAGIAPTASAASGGMGIVLDKDARLDAVLAIFEEKGIIISTPTTIQFPLSFSIGDTAFYSKADLESTTELVSEFISKAGVGKRILMWEEENRINFGFIKVVDNTSELHYIAIEVGS
jgi:uncharacterized membrane protein (UPF0182 family)